MIRIILFAVCTFIFLRISWRSLKNPGTHGFYRFFIFEGILLLVLLNHPYWLSNPFSPQQLLSWFFLFISIVFIIQSLMILRKKGGYAERAEMPENLTFENTTRIVNVGLYRYIRHPMYSSLLFLAWGAFLKQVTPLNCILILTVSGLIVVVAKVEEKENVQYFGRGYEEYMKHTKMFVPWLL